VSAGFDAHRNDPLAEMQLDAAAYGWMTSELTRLAETTAAGRIALVLEGGYDLAALETSLAESLRALAHPDRKPDATTPDRLHEGDIDRARQALADRWPDLR
jgi:acetoin utilization deacetylase AcuC-like enzyme